MCKHPNCGCANTCADANNPQVTERERRLEALLREFVAAWRGKSALMPTEEACAKAERELAR
jgi:hypothetical protein